MSRGATATIENMAPRRRPYTLGEISDTLDEHEKKLGEIYPSSAIIAKTWVYLKYATPAMVLSLLGNITPNSFLGKIISFVWEKATNG